MSERTMPHNNEAEQAILGSILLGYDLDTVTELVSAADFYRPSHRLIFQACLDLHETGTPVDAITLASQLESRGYLDDIGGRVYILDLGAAVSHTENTPHYAKVVREASTLRDIIAASSTISDLAFESPIALPDLATRAESLLKAAITGAHTATSTHDMQHHTEELKAFAQHRRTTQGLSGLPTGFPGIDALTDGLQRGQLWVIAARPSVGKSSLLENIAANLAETRVPVYLQELEQPAREVTMRLACSRSLTDSMLLKSGSLTEEQYTTFLAATEELAQQPITIDDAAGLHYAEIRRRMRHWRADHPQLNAVCLLDYLGLATWDPNMQPVHGLGLVSKSLKTTAKDLDIPVIALHQLNRASDTEKRRPVLADLRDSGQIEQDADVVIFIHRDTPPPHIGGMTRAPTTTAIIAKNRNGPIGDVPLAFVPYWTRFFCVHER